MKLYRTKHGQVLFRIGLIGVELWLPESKYWTHISMDAHAYIPRLTLIGNNVVFK